MVTIRIYGRTGNQCIMTSCALAYAFKHDLPYHIPAHTINDEIYPPTFTNLENPDYNPNLETIYIKENGREYFELPFEESWRNKNIELDGFWQSYLYFDDYKTEIVKILGFTDYQRPYGPWLGTGACIHWRMGDFKLYPTKHPIVTEKYMELAIKELLYRTAIRKIEIYSDNPEECFDFFKKNWSLSLEQCKVYLERMPHIHVTPLQKMMRMSQCGAHIISNSTFSWFSAWANTYPYKTVICPHEDNWYGVDNKHISVEHLLPKEWIRIKY